MTTCPHRWRNTPTRLHPDDTPISSSSAVRIRQLDSSLPRGRREGRVGFQQARGAKSRSDTADCANVKPTICWLRDEPGVFVQWRLPSCRSTGGTHGRILTDRATRSEAYHICFDDNVELFHRRCAAHRPTRRRSQKPRARLARSSRSFARCIMRSVTQDIASASSAIPSCEIAPLCCATDKVRNPEPRIWKNS